MNTDGSGKGTFSVTEPTGFYTATATDPNGNTSGSRTPRITGTAGHRLTTVSSSANPSTSGQQVTFTAVVTAPGFQGTPTGTVTFTIDGQAQTPVPLSVVGGVDEAQFVTSTLAAGQHTVTAAYSGDTNVSPSSGSLPTQTVNAPSLQATTTTLTSSSNPSTVGQQVTFTAVVTAPGYPGDADGDGDLHHRRPGADARAARGRRGRGRGAVRHVDAHGGAALGRGGVQRRYEREPQQRVAADADGERRRACRRRRPR